MKIKERQSVDKSSGHELCVQAPGGPVERSAVVPVVTSEGEVTNCLTESTIDDRRGIHGAAVAVIGQGEFSLTRSEEGSGKA